MNWEKHKTKTLLNFQALAASQSNSTSILSWDRMHRGGNQRASWRGEEFTAVQQKLDLERAKKCVMLFPSFPSAKAKWHSPLWSLRKLRKKIQKNWEAWNGKDAGWETTQGKKGGGNEKQQQANGTRKALLSEVQHDRKWHVECRKRKPDRYRLICWLPWKTCPSH